MNEPAGPVPSADEYEEMRHNVMTEVESRHRRSRVRTILAACAAIVAVAGTTAGVMAPKPASIGEQNTYFSCYLEPVATDRAPLDVSRMDWAAYRRAEVLPMDDRVRDALHLCSLTYADAEADVANPTACVLKDQRIGVFPNATDATPVTFCASIGLGAPR